LIDLLARLNQPPGRACPVAVTLAVADVRSLLIPGVIVVDIPAIATSIWLDFLPD
jgi:hypothetical protein